MPGTGSGFSGWGVCAGAGIGCCLAAGAEGPVPPPVSLMLGASACCTGRADCFVSLLSHPASRINPPPRTRILKRFTQLSKSTLFKSAVFKSQVFKSTISKATRSFLNHTFSLDDSGPRTAAIAPCGHQIGFQPLSHDCKGKGPGNRPRQG